MILVTGASGTLGRVGVRRLAEAGADVHGLSRRERAPEPGLT
ncbi:NAD-dependent epimerase/dehydratase family protein [Actinomadura geliboluensis]